MGDTTYMSITVRDKNTNQPVSDALVLLIIEPPNSNPSVGKTTTTEQQQQQQLLKLHIRIKMDMQYLLYK